MFDLTTRQSQDEVHHAETTAQHHNQYTHERLFQSINRWLAHARDALPVHALTERGFSTILQRSPLFPRSVVARHL